MFQRRNSFRAPLHCSVLQCVAVCCDVRCVAVCYSMLQSLTVCCGVLQCVAVCCSVLQCLAVSCSVIIWGYYPRLQHNPYMDGSSCHTRIDESSHTHIQRSHGTHIDESRHTHMDASCHKHEYIRGLIGVSIARAEGKFVLFELAF